MTVVRSLGEEENFDGNAEKDCIYTLWTEGTILLAPFPCSGFYSLPKGQYGQYPRLAGQAAP
jgi:hypothetical protein